RCRPLSATCETTGLTSWSPWLRPPDKGRLSELRPWSIGRPPGRLPHPHLQALPAAWTGILISGEQCRRSDGWMAGSIAHPAVPEGACASEPGTGEDPCIQRWRIERHGPLLRAALAPDVGFEPMRRLLFMPAEVPVFPFGCSAHATT